MKENENISKKITWDEKRNFRFNKYFEYLGITQDEFALKIGYPQSNINAILNNKRALGEKIIKNWRGRNAERRKEICRGSFANTL